MDDSKASSAASNAADKLTATSAKAGDATYSKEYLVNRSAFKFTDKAIMELALEDGKDYTIEDAKAAINKFKEAI